MNNLLINEYPLIVLPSLAENIGLNEAIILQQIHFWLTKQKHLKDGRYWVYNTYKEWEKQFPFWSNATIRRAIKSLERQNLIIVGNYNKVGFDNTKWYTINYNKLKQMSRPLAQNEQMACSKRADALAQNEQTNTIDYPKTNNIENSSSNAFAFYEQNFGVISPFLVEKINKWIDDLTEELVIEAMKIALTNNKQFNYAEGILRDWHKRNIRTLRDVEVATKEFKKKRTTSKKREVVDFEID